MQHILIPTDFSNNAWNATTYALSFFKNNKVTFHFLHIAIMLGSIDDKELNYAGLSFNDTNLETLEKKMKDWTQQLEGLHSNPFHTFKINYVKNTFIDGIRKYIASNGIDMIIMGTKGASGLKEITLGSKAGAVIKSVKCLNLVIPEEAKFKVPLTIGFPTDFNVQYKNSVLVTLKKVAKSHQSSIKVLRVAQNKKPLDDFQNNNRDILKERFKEIQHSFHIIENPNLESGLQSFINTMEIDIVAMIAKNLNLFQRILFKPRVSQISYHIKTPFLVIHE